MHACQGILSIYIVVPLAVINIMYIYSKNSVASAIYTFSYITVLPYFALYCIIKILYETGFEKTVPNRTLKVTR